MTRQEGKPRSLSFRLDWRAIVVRYTSAAKVEMVRRVYLVAFDASAGHLESQSLCSASPRLIQPLHRARRDYDQKGSSLMQHNLGCV